MSENIERVFIVDSFFVLDISDVSEESSQWSKNSESERPILINNNNDTNINKNGAFKNFTEQNFKGSRLIARSLNNFFRSIRLYFLSTEKKLKKPGRSGWGNFLYVNLEETDKKLWEPYGFNHGIKKIKENSKEISIIAQSIKAELYIVIYPWPDSLEYGQNKFNWEKFSYSLCKDINCTKLINFFPDFIAEKNKTNDWLTKLYIGGDLHITEYSHKIIAKKILKEVF